MIDSNIKSNQHSILRRILILLLAFMLAFSIIVTATLAWYDFNQSYINTMRAEGGNYKVILMKKDADTGEKLTGAQFELYKATGEKLSGPYTTGKDGKFEVDNLGVGEYYFREIIPPEGYDFSDTDNKHLFMISAQDDPNNIIPVNVTVENVRKNYPLTIQKKVNNADGTPLAEEQKEQNFLFDITFGDPDDQSTEYIYKLNNNPEQAFHNGDIIRLKHNDEVTFLKVPYKTLYQITERSAPGYTAEIDAPASGTLPEGGRIIKFTNTFAFGSLSITKSVKNTDGSELNAEQRDKLFIFTLTFSDGDSGTEYLWTLDKEVQPPIKSGETIQLRHGQTALFKGIAPGITYEVTETPETGYTQETVTQSGMISKGNVSEIEFVNSFDESLFDMGTLRLSKLVTGTDKEFCFTVTIGDPEDTATSYPMVLNGAAGIFKNGDMIKLKNEGYIEIFDIPVGTNYEVEESADIAYIQNVISKSGQITKAGILCDFQNIEIKKGKLTVTKTVVNKDGSALSEEQKNKVFHFTLFIDSIKVDEIELLSGEHYDFEYPIGSVYYINEDSYTDEGYKTEIDSGGDPQDGVISEFGKNVSFINIFDDMIHETINIEGEKTWELGNFGISAPESITIHIMCGDVVVADKIITEADDWKWSVVLPKFNDPSVSYTLTEDEVPGFETKISGYNITNTYNALPVILDPPVTKILTGNPAKAANFTFDLIAMTDGAPMPADSLGGKKTVTVQGEGKVEFGTIIFATEGIYVYTIKEQKGNEQGYTYDEAEYTMTVVTKFASDRVTLRKKVTYEKTLNGVKTTLKNIGIENPLSFVNTYTISTPKETSYAPIVKKLVSGNPPEKNTEEFYFEITGKDEAFPMPSSNKINIKGEGVASFGNIRFEKEGVYIYYIKENSGNAKGYIYDSSVYILTITVDRDINNNLTTKVRYVKDDDLEVNSNATFTNRYHDVSVSDTITVSGRKIWKHGNNPAVQQPKSITIYIKNRNQTIAKRTVTKKDNWAWSFELDRYDETGKEIKYSIKEKKINDYRAQYKGFDIINIHESLVVDHSETITIKGKKIWHHMDNPKEKWPDRVTIQLYNGNTVAASQIITAKEGWKYTFTMMKYDENGKEITYRIDETNIPGYGKYISGNDVFNTFDYSDNQIPPSTGDSTNVRWWIIFMVLSAGLLIVFHYLRCNNGREK